MYSQNVIPNIRLGAGESDASISRGWNVSLNKAMQIGLTAQSCVAMEKLIIIWSCVFTSKPVGLAREVIRPGAPLQIMKYFSTAAHAARPRYSAPQR